MESKYGRDWRMARGGTSEEGDIARENFVVRSLFCSSQEVDIVYYFRGGDLRRNILRDTGKVLV